MEEKNLAPVALFGFNRPRHLKRTLRSLSRCAEAPRTKLFFLVDGARSASDREAIEEQVAYVKSLHGFRSVEVLGRNHNIGLRENIVSGLNYVLEKHSSVIVLEDDIQVNRFFLSFMNQALARYSSDARVWHIGGYVDRLRLPRSLGDAFFSDQMFCWGWATWADRWRHYDGDPAKLVAEFSPRDIERFDLDGTKENWAQVLGNLEGRLETWAIFWMATIFRHKGLCLMPRKTLCANRGFDGSGVHHTDFSREQLRYLGSFRPKHFPQEAVENQEARARLADLYRRRKMSLRA